MSLDSALIGCIGRKYEGANGKAAMYFEKMIGLEQIHFYGMYMNMNMENMILKIIKKLEDYKYVIYNSTYSN